jgi:hypothetical protein
VGPNCSDVIQWISTASKGVEAVVITLAGVIDVPKVGFLAVNLPIPSAGWVEA